jgi:hypothetical protein
MLLILNTEEWKMTSKKKLIPKVSALEYAKDAHTRIDKVHGKIDAQFLYAHSRINQTQQAVQQLNDEAYAERMAKVAEEQVALLDKRDKAAAQALRKSKWLANFAYGFLGAAIALFILGLNIPSMTGIMTGISIILVIVALLCGTAS